MEGRALLAQADSIRQQGGHSPPYDYRELVPPYDIAATAALWREER